MGIGRSVTLSPPSRILSWKIHRQDIDGQARLPSGDFGETAVKIPSGTSHRWIA